MRTIITRILVFAVFFVAMTFSGMTVFGMHRVMAHTTMSDVACSASECETPDASSSHPGRCLDHCLSQVSFAASIPVSEGFLLFFVPMIACVAVGWRSEDRRHSFFRYRDAIHLELLHRCLAPMVLKE
jgi:hypothetical protein